jgi:vancomycin permeability regulator SanA
VVEPARSRRSRWLLRIPLFVALLVVGYLAVTAVQVVQASGRDEREPVGAIVVLGAAQYDGRPSPALQRRLDHALELYEQDLAPRIVLTGAKQPDDRFTEAFAGFRYLTEQGVGEPALRIVDDGASTWESLAAAWRVLRGEGVEEVLLVSDSYHNRRLQGIAGELGMQAYVSPTDGGAGPGDVITETGRIAVGQVIGYRRLFNMTG